MSEGVLRLVGEREVRVACAEELLEAVLDRVRREGVLHLSVYYEPLGGGDPSADFYTEDTVRLVGALEVQKFDVLRYRRDGE